MPLLPSFQVKKAALDAPQQFTPVPNQQHQRPQQATEQQQQQAAEQQQQQVTEQQQQLQQATQHQLQQATEQHQHQHATQQQPLSPAAAGSSQQAVPQEGSPATGPSAPAKEELLASGDPSSSGQELTSENDGEVLGTNGESNINTEKPDNSKKTKSKKDPSAPKAALTSYMVFSGVERGKVLGDLGNLGTGEVSKELGRRWRELTTEAKAGYEEEAARDRARFKQELEAHTGVKVEDKPKKAKTKTDKVKVPKEKKRVKEVAVEAAGAMTDYFAFLFSQWSSARARHPSACPSTLQAILWTRWSRPGVLEAAEAPPAKRRRSQAPSRPPAATAAAARLFMDTVREGVLAANPGMTEDEMCRKLTRVWEGLDKEDKEPFIGQSKEGREVGSAGAEGPTD